MRNEKIRAQDVKPGMEIRWEEDGAVITLPVFEVMTADCGRVSFVPESRTPWHVKRDQVVTVLREPQPEEPTAFGACVEVAGVKYVRCDDDDLKWKSSDGAGWWGWSDLCDKGQVTIVIADPFASTEQREPRVWDRWADVPEMTPVRVAYIDTPYRKVGDRIERKPVKAWEPVCAGEHELNIYSPFTEVLPGA